MKLEVEIGDALADQIQTAVDLTGLPRDELVRRAIMTFCWISPASRWEFLHLLDHDLIEAGVDMARIAQLLEDVRRIVPKAPPADEDLATRAALEAAANRLDVPPDDPVYVGALATVGSFFGAPLTKEIATIAAMPRRPREAFAIALSDAVQEALDTAKTEGSR